MTRADPATSPLVEITVVEVQGSAPREPGARMYWYPDGSTRETIGGGNLEQQALDEAQALWKDPERTTALLEFPLSAKLGQCCGGFVRLFLSKQTPKEQVLICGAGHVSTAVAKVLADTPLEVTVVDSREQWAEAGRFPENVNVVTDDPEALIHEWGSRAEKTYLLIMTHNHPVDQALCQLSLRFGFKWIGLIGSRTKWLRFRQRLRARGFTDEELNRIVSPIGDPSLGKSPYEIAVGVAAQLLALYHGSSKESQSAAPEPSAPGLRAALILAGGASSRMGRWKGGLEFEGEPLVKAHARVFSAAGAEIWKAVYPEPDRETAERIIGPEHRIMNPTPTAPLFSSLQLGLRRLVMENPDLDSLLMSPVDMVPLDEDWVAALWDRHETSNAWVTQPSIASGDAERPIRHGHPIILGRQLFAMILASDPDDARLDFIVRDLPEENKATLELPGAAALTNLNTPEDFAKALAE